MASIFLESARVQDAMSALEPTIHSSMTIMGFHNDLVAVRYRNGIHFTGTFFYDGAGYEYDGCQNGGICRLMNMVGSSVVFKSKSMKLLVYGHQLSCGIIEGMQRSFDFTHVSRLITI